MARYNVKDYRVTPSVVCCGVPTEITVAPRGANARFSDGVDYILEIFAADEATAVLDPVREHMTPIRRRLTLHATDGCLRFTETFDTEQQYVLKIILPEEQQYSTNPHYNPPYRSVHSPLKAMPLRVPTLSVFAVQPDLFGMKVFRGDLHSHTWDSDGHESNCGIVANWRRAGHDFGAITNHYWYHSREQALKAFDGLPQVLTLLPGEEVHVTSESVHAVAIGGRQSVNDYYYEHTEQCRAEITALEKDLDIPEGIDPHNYACRCWIADKIREFGGIAVMAHPFWIWENVDFMPLSLTRLLYERGVYDCLEINCGDHEESNLTMSLYYDELAHGFSLPLVGSSDCHNTDAHEPSLPSVGSTLLLARDASPESLREAILSRRSAVWEQWPGESSCRLYGSFRMVRYMNFLVNDYYPAYTELCYPQGELMKEYETDPDPAIAELLRQHKARSDAFSDAFFGIKK